jgi:hypothetical protein
MLKSSDRISHDIDILLSQQWRHAVRPAPVLVLCKWHDLRPEREFRCFVKGGDLVGACQRDISQHFPQLAAPTAIRRGVESQGRLGVGAVEVIGTRGLQQCSDLECPAEAVIMRDRGTSASSRGPLDDIKLAIAAFHRNSVSAVFTLPQCEGGMGRRDEDRV